MDEKGRMVSARHIFGFCLGISTFSASSSREAATSMHLNYRCYTSREIKQCDCKISSLPDGFLWSAWSSSLQCNASLLLWGIPCSQGAARFVHHLCSLTALTLQVASLTRPDLCLTLLTVIALHLGLVLEFPGHTFLLGAHTDGAIPDRLIYEFNLMPTKSTNLHRLGSKPFETMAKDWIC